MDEIRYIAENLGKTEKDAVKLFETFLFGLRVPSINGGSVLKGKDLTGKRFGKLTVLSYARKENGFHLYHTSVWQMKL